MLDSVPVVRKFASTSTPGVMLPVPLTVDWTTPRAAVTIWVEVRVDAIGVPTSNTPATSSATPSAASTTINQLGRVRVLSGKRRPGCATYLT
jgi:hypothetical protein